MFNSKASHRGRLTNRCGSLVRQTRTLLATQGLRGVTDKISGVTADWLLPKASRLPVKKEDVLAADISRRPQPRLLPLASGQQLSINWVCIPARSGSGGHTTMFRIIRYLQTLGCHNRLYFYNVYGADLPHYESVARESYGFTGTIGDVEKGMEDAHAVVASSWPTAYPVFNSSCAGARFYFVQDFEPSFYPTSSLSLLAENTYRMGFHGITAGRWLSAKLQSEFAMPAEGFDFGCDTSVYQRESDSRRSGIVFYARPETARRGFELGAMAIEIFARAHPQIDIHFYGAKVGRQSFAFRDHGNISPFALNKIYNQCFAGLSISLTNVSLVPHEMLAAGCIPIVNEGLQNRLVLDNHFVQYVAPAPHALAAALAEIVADPDFSVRSQAAAKSIGSSSWETAANTVLKIIRRKLAAG